MREAEIRKKLETGIKLNESERKWLCHELMTTEENMERLILNYFEDEDFLEVYRRRIGGGMIGGKACGMLAGRKIVEKDMPDFAGSFLPHDSFYIGTDVFYTYLKENGCLELWKENAAGVKREPERLVEMLENGVFSEETKEGFARITSEYKNVPFIVRSSSMLEDGFGNAFSGKYESIFCVARGDGAESLKVLEDAVRRIYVSTLNPSAVEYRKQWHLAGTEEKMSLLVQRVEGRFYGDYYFPVAAGMGCSYNSYKWMESLNPDAGMLRVVAGLGTKAVERSSDDYPRMIGLERPEARMHATVAERHRFSQRMADVLEKDTGKLCRIPVQELVPLLPKYCVDLILSRDTEAETRLMEQRQFRKVYFADCEGIAEKSGFMSGMKKMLKALEKGYGSPVDIEFALDISEEGEIRINLFQCRPIHAGPSRTVLIPEGADDRILFDVKNASMQRSKEERIDMIVWIDPQKYYECPYAEKSDVARMVGEINRYYEPGTKKIMLLAPGRIGTSSPELGVPVSYADISRFCAICEVEYSRSGYSPELSYGSHMFQDLVEADIYYGAIEEGRRTRLYQPGLLKNFPEMFLKMFPDEYDLGRIVKVYDLSDGNVRLMLDSKSGRAVCVAGNGENRRKHADNEGRI